MGNNNVIHSKPRQISYKKEKIEAIISIILIIASIIVYVFAYTKNNNIIKSISIAVCFLAILLLIVCISEIKRIKKENEHLRNLDYYFDYDIEVDTYKIIGRDNSKKKLKDEVKSYTKYSEWKEAILTKYENCIGKDDFYRYLNKKLRETENNLDLYKTVLVPIELGIIAIFCSGNELGTGFNIICCLIASIVLIFVITKEINNTNNEKNFLTDMCEIAKEQIKKETHKEVA